MIRILKMIAVLLALAFQAQAEGFDEKLFKTFVEARTGLDVGKPVYWYSIGTLRAFPSGETIAIMEGLDATTATWADRETFFVEQYNRKIYIFRDPKTGAVLREMNGRPVTPIAYPYQFITYALKGDKVVTMVEQGEGARVQRLGPFDNMAAKRVGNTAVFTAPLYLDIPIPGGDRRLQAFENYDFLIHPKTSRVEKPNQLTWVRTGALPPWAGAGQGVMHLITWRVDSFEAMPESLKTYIRTEQPLWLKPPANLDEVRALQE
jgi:hypothetical protein